MAWFESWYSYNSCRNSDLVMFDVAVQAELEKAQFAS